MRGREWGWGRGGGRVGAAEADRDLRLLVVLLRAGSGPRLVVLREPH